MTTELKSGWIRRPCGARCRAVAVSPAAAAAAADADADACCLPAAACRRRRRRLWNLNPISKPNEDAPKVIDNSLSTKVQAMSDNEEVAAPQASAVCSAACVAGF